MVAVTLTYLPRPPPSSRRRPPARSSKIFGLTRPSSLSRYMVSMRPFKPSWRTRNFLMASARAACSVRSDSRTVSASHWRIASGITRSPRTPANSVVSTSCRVYGSGHFPRLPVQRSEERRVGSDWSSDVCSSDLPLEDRLGDHQISQDAGELGGEYLLPGVWLWALSPVAGTVIVDIAPFFQFTDEVAPAMTAMDQTGERKIVFDLPGLVLDPRIEQLLNAFPTRAAHQWLMGTLVGYSIPVEFTHVQTVAKDLMD